MKLASASLAILFSSVSGELFSPKRIDYGMLAQDPLYMENASLIIDELSKEGLVSVTNIPGFAKVKKQVMKYLHACITDLGDDVVPSALLKDGTIRRTMAGTKGHSLSYFESHGAISHSCELFQAASDAFRKSVDEATDVFAQRLSFELGSSVSSPLMSTQDGSHTYEDVKDLVDSAEVLEHFHSYQKSSNAATEATIDLHLDQGFFIAFSPGLDVSVDPNASQPLKINHDFVIVASEGKESTLYTNESDDLVFMMGDGVNQYINNHLHKNSVAQNKVLRAVPHSVVLASHDPSVARVWYGRMVLPPRDAYSAVTDKSYGDVRDILMNRDTSQVPAGLGCSSMTMRALNAGGTHNDSPCAEDTLQCWAMCMPLANFGIENEATCTDQSLRLQCVNPRDQFSPGFEHGDYFPACSNTTQEVTPVPQIPQQDEDNCASLWEEFRMDSSYDHHFDLSTDVNDGASFMWSIVDGKVKGRLAFNNVFGWLSIGLANKAADAKKNGMNGANVLIATPGKEYSAQTGLDTSSGPVVQEYLIHSSESSFRHWQTPTGEDPSASVVTTECFTALEFETDNINDIPFNVAGTDELIWGGNRNDHFMGYHGKNRDRFTLNWMSGESYFGKLKVVEEEDDEVKKNNAVIIGGAVGGTIAALVLISLAVMKSRSSSSKNDKLEQAP